MTDTGGTEQVTRRPIAVDVFCGGGGISLGFARHFDIACGIDSDKDSIDTFRAAHFPGLPKDRLDVVAPQHTVDLEHIDDTVQLIRAAIHPREELDVLVGGPSCQGVSAAGLRNPNDHRNDMLKAFVALVDKLRPRWFVMENVPGLTHANNRDLLAAIFAMFEAIGEADGQRYEIRGDVLLAADYGVPQLRYRLFVVGTHTGAPIRFPTPTHALKPRLNGIDHYVTTWQAIGDLDRFTPAVFAADAAPEDATERLVVPDKRPHNHYRIETERANLERIAAVRPGQDWRSMPIGLLPERYFATRVSDQKNAYGRLHPDWPAYTITGAAYNVSAGAFTHPTRNRPLSVREAARLQSFPDDHVLYGRLYSQYRQVGNAVPPQLAEAVAMAIRQCDHLGEGARGYGVPGRLTGDVVRKGVEKPSTFPTMTPRLPHPDFDRRRRPTSVPRRQQKGNEPASAWAAEPRPGDPRPDETRQLRSLAAQPHYYRAAKRALAIVRFVDGEDKDEIVAAANVAERSVQGWVDDYYARGLDGWRAYHTPIERIAKNDMVLRKDLADAVKRVREIIAAPIMTDDKNEEPLKRLYMNPFVLELRKTFGDRSTAQILEDVELRLGAAPGTVYLGDLLAIWDIVKELPIADDVLEQGQLPMEEHVDQMGQLEPLAAV